jgi:hypothetical protein
MVIFYLLAIASWGSVMFIDLKTPVWKKDNDLSTYDQKSS